MVGRFKSNAPVNNFILFVYALFIKWPMFYDPQLPAVNNNDAFLYRSLVSFLTSSGKSFSLLFSVFAFILFFTQAIILNRIFINQKLFQKSCHLPGMSFILISALLQDFNAFSAPLIGSSFLVWILYRLSMLQPAQEAKKSIFDTAMLSGLAILFYQPGIFFTIFLFYGLSVMRPFRIAEWILTVLGIITPFYFLWAFLFVSGTKQAGLLNPMSFGVPHFILNNYELAAIAMVIICTLIGFVFVQNNIRRLLVQSRKTWSLIYFFLFISLLVLFQKTSYNAEVLILIAVPASSVSSAAFFYPDKKWFPALMHWGMFILSVLIGYSFFKH